jgi:hypothetical protein
MGVGYSYVWVCMDGSLSVSHIGHVYSSFGHFIMIHWGLFKFECVCNMFFYELSTF